MADSNTQVNTANNHRIGKSAPYVETDSVIDHKMILPAGLMAVK